MFAIKLYGLKLFVTQTDGNMCTQTYTSSRIFLRNFGLETTPTLTFVEGVEKIILTLTNAIRTYEKINSSIKCMVFKVINFHMLSHGNHTTRW